MRRSLLAVVTTAVALGLAAVPASAPTTISRPARSSTSPSKASGGTAAGPNPYDYDLLIAAVTATGLAPPCSPTRARAFTVFAPNDRAFERLVADLDRHLPGERAGDARRDPGHVHARPDQERPALPRGRGQELGPLQVLFAGSLTMANGGTVRPRGLSLRDETPALRDPRLLLYGLNIQATNGVDPHDRPGAACRRRHSRMRRARG